MIVHREYAICIIEVGSDMWVKELRPFTEDPAQHFLREDRTTNRWHNTRKGMKERMKNSTREKLDGTRSRKRYLLLWRETTTTADASWQCICI